MNQFTYKMGEWSPGIDWSGLKDNAEEYKDEDWENYLKLMGFKKNEVIGEDYGSCIQIYLHESTNQFLAEIDFSGYGYEVLIADFPSLMMFLRDFSSILSNLQISYLQTEIMEILNKIFQIYHGHEPHGICEKCSPEEWKKFVEARRLRRNKENKTS